MYRDALVWRPTSLWSFPARSSQSLNPMSVLGHIHPMAGTVYLSCFSLSKLISWEGAQPSSLDGIWSCGRGSCQGFGHIAAITSHNAARDIGSFGHPFSLYSVGVLLQKKKNKQHPQMVSVWQKISFWTLNVVVKLVPSELGWLYSLYPFYNRVTAAIQLDSPVHSAQISALSVPLRTEECAQRCSHPQTLVPGHLQSCSTDLQCPEFGCNKCRSFNTISYVCTWDRIMFVGISNPKDHNM